MDVLAMPDRISKGVLDRALDANTAFEIVSIDIADMDVGENIGARLQTDRADADMQSAQARAEVRRAEALACQQEMKAKATENRAMLLMAEADVPVAIATAFRVGQVHVGRTRQPQKGHGRDSPTIMAPFERNDSAIPGIWLTQSEEGQA